MTHTHHPLVTSPAVKQVTITDAFWQDYQDLIRDVVVPYQWQALNDQVADAEPSHAIENFRIAAGQQDGTFYGMVFQDSDIAKWLEAVAYLLGQQADAELEKTADELISLVAAAQQPDGYLNTYFTVKAPEARWNNLAECHELYCAGHLIEAAVAYFENTGKRQLLDVVCRFADLIADVFGPQAQQIHGYPGHPEIELALVRLYEVTEVPRYLELARYFIEQRGQSPHFYDEEYERRGKTSYWQTHGPAWMVKDKAYSQAHLPINEQTEAVGHAVRFVYLYTGVAHLARHLHDEQKRQVCQRLWQDVVQRQMYVTGAIGSQSQGEAFTCDYDLPSDTAYTETCASIGLIMFARRMLELDPDSQYADVMERALFNTVLSGMALDGKHFFYVNPLEVTPNAIVANHIYDHVKVTRQQWFGCACCPPNIARLLASLGSYIYTVSDNCVYINLYIGNETKLALPDGELTLAMQSQLPWQGDVTIDIATQTPVEATLALRLPQWSPQVDVTLNGEPCPQPGNVRDGYLYLRRCWQKNDALTVTMAMPVRRITANTKVRHLMGKVALQRGPLVYCLEQEDNGPELHTLRLPEASPIAAVKGREGVLAGKILLTADGLRYSAGSEQSDLYYFDQSTSAGANQPLTFIPYFLWANRRVGEMRVWLASC